MSEDKIKKTEEQLNEEQIDEVNGGGVPSYLQEPKTTGTAPI